MDLALRPPAFLNTIAGEDEADAALLADADENCLLDEFPGIKHERASCKVCQSYDVLWSVYL